MLRLPAMVEHLTCKERNFHTELDRLSRRGRDAEVCLIRKKDHMRTQWKNSSLVPRKKYFIRTQFCPNFELPEFRAMKGHREIFQLIGCLHCKS